MGKIRVGISGWSYDAWRGDFYPEDLARGDELSYASRRLGSVEINGSFYGLQAPSSYRSWYQATPRGFVLAVKGSRFITHNKSLKDVGTPLANFFASGVLALEEKLGPILWQTSERTRFVADRVRTFLELLPRDTEAAARLARRHDDRVEDTWTRIDHNHRLRHVFEARHESWLVPEFARIARDTGTAIVFSDSASWPSTEEVTAGFVYLRLHGAEETYASGYGGRALDRWAERIRAWSRGRQPEDANRITDRPPPRRKTRDVYVYFDNDARGRAPWDARSLAERLGVAPDTPED
ncbi:MAG: DUF72 domain-containing protein [Gemmatimonadota bacterium]